MRRRAMLQPARLDHHAPRYQKGFLTRIMNQHQIWLLRNVLWWYILPIAVSVLFMAVQFLLYLPTSLPPNVALIVKIAVGLAVVGPAWAFDWWVWKINQKAIRENLAPELAELEARRCEITGGSPTEV